MSFEALVETCATFVAAGFATEAAGILLPVWDVVEGDFFNATALLLEVLTSGLALDAAMALPAAFVNVFSREAAGLARALPVGVAFALDGADVREPKDVLDVLFLTALLAVAEVAAFRGELLPRGDVDFRGDIEA